MGVWRSCAGEPQRAHPQKLAENVDDGQPVARVVVAWVGVLLHVHKVDLEAFQWPFGCDWLRNRDGFRPRHHLFSFLFAHGGLYVFQRYPEVLAL